MINLIKIFDYAKEDLWRDVVGYEGLYQVSHTGKVRSLNYRGIGKVQELKPRIMDNGYFYINLYKNEKMKTKLVHRLVAEAFIPNHENKPYIDHINTKKLDNHVSNLRWCTRIENANNEITKFNMCLSKIGEKNPQSKKYYLYDRNMKFILKFDTRGQLGFFLSKYTNLKDTSIETYLSKNNKYTIVNKGILFAEQFYIYDYKLD